MSVRLKRLFFQIILILFLVLLDLYTKGLAYAHLQQKSFVVIPNVLELCYLENTGAAFSMLSGKMIVFYIITPIMVFALCYILHKLPSEHKYRCLRISLLFLIAGALGNFYDRIVFHYVRDFIYFSLINFPVFNVADIYVTCSIFFIIVLILFVYKEEDLKF